MPAPMFEHVRWRRRWSARAAALIAAMAAGVAVSGASLSSAAQQAGPDTVPGSARLASPLFGTQYRGNWDYTDRERTELLNKLASAGVKWLRMGITWSGVQPRKPTPSDPGYSSAALARLDQVIAEAHVRGLQVSATFGSTPRWASGGRGPTALPTDPGDYARVAEFLARRYRGQVQSWEVYNEPNLPKKMQAAPAAYTQLLCRAYPAYHRAVGDITVISGGTAGNDWEWVQKLYGAGGKGCFDVLATHAYQAEARPPGYPPRSDDRWWFQNIALVREVMIDHGDAATPIWITETGWSTHPDVGCCKPGVTLQQQADYLEQMLDLTTARYPYVRRISWYMARNETHSDIQHNNFGLYYTNLDPKPSALRVQQLLG